MNQDLNESRKLSDQHRDQRDSARVERDSALEERDSARTERDDFKDQAFNLEKDSVAQEQFVATLSHDLRNPMGVIKMAIDLIRDGVNPTQQKEMIDLIDRSADQAGELINQLLDAHLIKSGARLPLNLGHCNLLAVLDKCHQSLAPAQQGKVIVRTYGVEAITGYWDAAALERAIKNLISNAIKFGNAGKEIQLAAWQGPDIVSISVQNFGEVISLENQPKIFDSHFRIPSLDSKNKKGWGLGLTLVKGIVESHNGKVEVASSISEGTVFTLKLPNDSRLI